MVHEPHFSEPPRMALSPINNNNQQYVEKRYTRNSPEQPYRAPSPVNNNTQGYTENSCRRNFPE